MSLFLLQGVVGCRGCLGLRYQSQDGVWSRDLLGRMTARLQALGRRPGPRGGQHRVWRRRLARTNAAMQQWLQRFDERYGPALRCGQLSAAARALRRLS
jgi:hypothetical protein